MINTLSSLGGLRPSSEKIFSLKGSLSIDNLYASLSYDRGIIYDISGGSYTFECWVKPVFNAARPQNLASIGHTQGIIGFDDSGSGIFLAADASGIFRFGCKPIDSNSNLLGSPITPDPLNPWYHLAVVRDTSNNITMYVNGNNYINDHELPSFKFRHYHIGRLFLTTFGNTCHIGTLITGIRFSIIARYSSNFTPSRRRYTNDNNLIVAHNVDNSTDRFNNINNFNTSLTVQGTVSFSMETVPFSMEIP